MAILLKKVARKNPQEPEASPLYYPVQNTIKQVDETTVAELIADETTLNPAEALMAIRQLRKVMVRELLNSNSVKLGNWGSFSITLNCKGFAPKSNRKQRRKSEHPFHSGTRVERIFAKG